MGKNQLTDARKIDAQFSIGYESSGGFRSVFSNIMGTPTLQANLRILKAAWLNTRLGPMIAIADEDGLYLLEFVDRRGLEGGIEHLRNKLKAAILPGETPVIIRIRNELTQYFNGKKITFEIPIHWVGSPFQKKVWETLRKIPFGETRSYADIAKSINKPTAYRAVAQANGANQLAIIVPCHRVINANGKLGGYGAGIRRKRWLLEQEKKVINNE